MPRNRGGKNRNNGNNGSGNGGGGGNNNNNKGNGGQNNNNTGGQNNNNNRGPGAGGQRGGQNGGKGGYQGKNYNPNFKNNGNSNNNGWQNNNQSGNQGGKQDNNNAGRSDSNADIKVYRNMFDQPRPAFQTLREIQELAQIHQGTNPPEPAIVFSTDNVEPLDTTAAQTPNDKDGFRDPRDFVQIEDIDPVLNCYANYHIRSLRPEILCQMDQQELLVHLISMFGYPLSQQIEPRPITLKGNSMFDDHSAAQSQAWKRGLASHVVDKIREVFYTFNVFHFQDLLELDSFTKMVPEESRHFIRQVILGPQMMAITSPWQAPNSEDCTKDNVEMIRRLKLMPNLSALQFDFHYGFDDTRYSLAKRICTLFPRLLKVNIGLPSDGVGMQMVDTIQVSRIKEHVKYTLQLIEADIRVKEEQNRSNMDYMY